MNRRRILEGGAAALALASAGGLRLARPARAAQFSLPSGTLAEQALEALPGKAPLIKKTHRPPNYETPISFLNEPYTPNRAFFVRYHLADIPKVDAATWKLKVGGAGAERGLELTLAAAFPILTSRESSGAMALSATQDGAAYA